MSKILPTGPRVAPRGTQRALKRRPCHVTCINAERRSARDQDAAGLGTKVQWIRRRTAAIGPSGRSKLVCRNFRRCGVWSPDLLEGRPLCSVRMTPDDIALGIERGGRNTDGVRLANRLCDALAEAAFYLFEQQIKPRRGTGVVSRSIGGGRVVRSPHGGVGSWRVSLAHVAFPEGVPRTTSPSPVNHPGLGTIY